MFFLACKTNVTLSIICSDFPNKRYILRNWRKSWTKARRRKGANNGVINDPLGQTHSPVSRDTYFHLKYILFSNVWTDGRTDDKRENSDPYWRDCGSGREDQFLLLGLTFQKRPHKFNDTSSNRYKIQLAEIFNYSVFYSNGNFKLDNKCHKCFRYSVSYSKFKKQNFS